MPKRLPLPWLAAGQALPATESAWGHGSQAPGLLAAGGDLSVPALHQAYSAGVFPWFSEGQPILWWSPDPRMVLEVANFQMRRSLKKTLQKFRADDACTVQMDTSFSRVIEACATSPRAGQDGTWIVPEMLRAYRDLHRAGHAHSVETWIDGRLVGGLYCVSLGQAVFGESMFSVESDASKIALSALVCFCRHNGIAWIDCQQNTSHLATLGAGELPRVRFLALLSRAVRQEAPHWHFEPLYWDELLPSRPSRT